jgi:formylglycine-generating enzyme required for sulfatase activity
MASGVGGITRSGIGGSYTYSAIAGREGLPVNWVTFYDAARFANWLQNGQGSGDTETGAYTLVGGTETPTRTTFTRNASATIFLPSEDEWYKAAYYSPQAASYFDFPGGSATEMTCGSPTFAPPNFANCGSSYGDLTNAGSYTASASPYGTFDQGGNIAEWNETLIVLSDCGLRGSYFAGPHPCSPRRSGRARTAATSITPTGFGLRASPSPEPGSW